MTKTMRNAAVAVVGTLGMASMALAAPINLAVVNADFEADAATRSAENYYSATTGWTTPTNNFGTINLPKLLIAHPTGFGGYSTADLTTLQVVHQSQLGAAQGVTKAFQILSSNFAANTNYVFSLLSGDSYEDPGSTYTISILSGATVLSSFTAAIPAAVTSVQSSVSYATGASGAELGTPITIQIEAGGGGTKAFDNVSVTADNGGTAVPEPASLSLLALGGAAMLRRRRA